MRLILEEESDKEDEFATKVVIDDSSNGNIANVESANMPLSDEMLRSDLNELDRMMAEQRLEVDLAVEGGEIKIEADIDIKLLSERNGITLKATEGEYKIQLNKKSYERDFYEYDDNDDDDDDMTGDSEDEESENEEQPPEPKPGQESIEAEEQEEEQGTGLRWWSRNSIGINKSLTSRKLLNP
ncbi:hypothetical protein BGZ83_010709 [Gryganskiella cystojenkinii]|nr:hypothetical protein BGZ83_010709 [Gryganskiella cystojenkinii]